MECAVPVWAGDNFCDDENNNPECGFDGGDCCDNTGEGWDNYCSLCECLEMPETTEPPMETTEEPWYTTEEPMETTEGKLRPDGQANKLTLFHEFSVRSSACEIPKRRQVGILLIMLMNPV